MYGAVSLSVCVCVLVFSGLGRLSYNRSLAVSPRGPRPLGPLEEARKRPVSRYQITKLQNLNPEIRGSPSFPNPKTPTSHPAAGFRV